MGPIAGLADSAQFAKLMRRLQRHDWVVYAKPAFGGPLRVLRYLELVPEAAASYRSGTTFELSTARTSRPARILLVASHILRGIPSHRR